MNKDDINPDYPQHSLTGVTSKLALLHDLFCGHGTDLSLGEQAIDGLCTLLRELNDTIETVQKAIPNRAVIDSRATLAGRVAH